MIKIKMSNNSYKDIALNGTNQIQFTIHKQLCRLLRLTGCIGRYALELAVMATTDALNAQRTDSGRHFCYRYLVLIVGNATAIQQPLERYGHIPFRGHALNGLGIPRIGGIRITSKGEGHNLRRD